MTGTEERARAAMRAIAGTVDDAPPLRLPPARAAGAPDEVRFGPHGAGRPGSGGRNRRRRSWLAPVAAAAVITALAVTLAIVRSIPNGGVAAPPSSAPAVVSSASSGAAAPIGVPEYYVAWMQADAPYLVVGNTSTGQQVAMVNAPAGIFLEEVYGAAADDRTFVVTGLRLYGTDAEATVWYLLRIAPGSSQTGRYTACTSPADTKCAYTQRNFIGFLRVTHDSQGATYQGMDVASACPSPTGSDNAAYLGWASADGSVIIGSEVCAGHARFGIFSSGGFTPLPALPNSLPVPAGALEGTFAW